MIQNQFLVFSLFVGIFPHVSEISLLFLLKNTKYITGYTFGIWHTLRKGENAVFISFIDGKYQACIAGWNQGVFGYVPGYGFHYDVIGEESLRHNLQMMKPKLEGFVEGWNAIAAPATTATIPEINVNTTEKVPDLMQFQVWYFFFYVGRCPEWVQFRLFLCKAEAADGCGTLSCGLFVAVMSRCFAGTKQMAGAE